MHAVVRVKKTLASSRTVNSEWSIFWRADARAKRAQAEAYRAQYAAGNSAPASLRSPSHDKSQAGLLDLINAYEVMAVDCDKSANEADREGR